MDKIGEFDYKARQIVGAAEVESNINNVSSWIMPTKKTV